MYSRYVHVLFAYCSEVRQENARQERTFITETLIYASEYAYLCTQPHNMIYYIPAVRLSHRKNKLYIDKSI